MDGWVAVTVKNQKLICTNEVSRDSTIRSKNSFDLLDSNSTPIGPNPPLLPHATTLPLPTTTTPDDDASTTTQPCSSRRQLRKRHARHILHLLAQQEDAFLNKAIATAEHERTRLAKEDLSNPRRQAIDAAHAYPNAAPSLTHLGINLGQTLASNVKRAAQRLTSTKHVHFAHTHTVRRFHQDHVPTVLATYDSGADGHYISERDRAAANLPILRPSTKRVGVANGNTCSAKHVTALPFPNLSPAASRADTFNQFPTSLLSVGRLSDDNTVSIFTKDGVSVHRETDVLITCQGEPILIGVRDDQGRYRIPLIQQRGQWQPRPPRARVNKALQQAHSVYDLPSVEQAIRWMHAVCGYPVKSTWIKAIKAGNFVGWPLLTEKNVAKYYPDTDETPKGHLNQTRKMSAPPNTTLHHSSTPTAPPCEGRRSRTSTPPSTMSEKPSSPTKPVNSPHGPAGATSMSW